ncbi:MAG: hypothetical protein IKJ88_07490 [Clostridia bacterium]|nr:hypothetical protein [Clostridia bacterium]
MKKTLALIMALLMCLSLSACGGKSKELTVDNYSDYLNISVIPLFTGKDWLIKPTGSPNSISCNSQAECSFNIKSASPNYDYENVVITIRVTATYNTYRSFDKTPNVAFADEITITCDIGGNGTGKLVIFEGIEKTYQIEENSLDYDWEVVAVQGTAISVG